MGNIYGIADRREIRPVIRTDVSDHDGARVDSDAEIDRQPLGRIVNLDLLVSCGDRVSDFDGRGDRLYGVVRIGNRSAEISHHRVTDEFVDRPSVVEDAVRHQLEDLVEQ